MSERDELVDLISGLGEAQLRQLRNIAWAMLVEVEVERLSGSDLSTARFSAEFVARLQAHHGTHSKPLDRAPWEDALRHGM